MDLLLDEEPAAGGAALAAVEVDRVEGAGDGVVHVGVGEDDVGALAAELEGRPLERLGRLALDDLGGIDVAGEGDLVDVGMGDQGRAGGLAEAVDQVDHARRETGLDGELADAERGQRGLLGGLHDHGVAAGEGRAPLPGEHQEREVPGDDLADHADRLAKRVREEAAADRDGLPFDLVGPAGVVAERVDHAFHVADRVVDRLAGSCTTSSAASSSALRSTSSARLKRSRPRSAASSWPQGPSSRARRAALTARSTSAAVPSATWAMTSPVAGLIRLEFPPSTGSTHWLSIKSRVCRTLGFAVGARRV